MQPIETTEYKTRLYKLEKIKAKGINPYPSVSKRTHEISEILNNYEHFLESKAVVTIAGRIMALREHGGSTFVDLYDGTDRVQVYFKKDKLSDSSLSYQDFIDFIDTGDFIDVQGEVFITKAGEKTVLVESWGILAKTVQPIPREWYSIKDPETRYRKRYLDFLLHLSQKDIFIRKARFWNSMREFLISKGFLEVYTPVLENTPGGADAKPFITHHNALDMDVYLRISTGELWQKRLMVAGFTKIFEIGRQFRNEGIDAEHLQDYTQMEFYFAYADYNLGMELTEELIKYVAKETFNTLKFRINEFDVDLEYRFDRVDFKDAIYKELNMDVFAVPLDDLRYKLNELHIAYEKNFDRARLVDLLWKYCRKRIAGPIYVIHTPLELSPLAKKSSKNPQVTERFQLILGGSEVCNGYSELNDPFDQRQRFLEQASLREAGDEEAQMHDEEFVKALEYGMPPVCGLGISERLFAFLEGKSVRECTMFPLMRPAESRITNYENDRVGIRDIGITRDKALELLQSHIKNPNLIKHHLAAEAQMRMLAEYLGDPNPHAWAMAGLLHDMDWEETENDFTKHSLVSSEILNKLGIHPAIVNAIKVHNHVHGIEPQTLLEKALYCAEELTGLVVADALVQPDKKLASVDVESVMRKFKDKAFARNVNRDIILKCKKFLDMKLEKLIELTIKAMQDIAEDLSL